MGTVAQRRDERIRHTKDELGTRRSVNLVSDEPQRALDPEAWEKTDRQFRFPGWRQGTSRTMHATTDTRTNNPARTRSLEAHDIHTQFLDAGIGCTWFAYKGDDEPVSGETEDEAIARLAREYGLEL
jgi:hypothetical protein